ncbi:hypothetical protein BDN71DRAFT_1224622 [Pleurotus eryngii]|uniref:Uncharacterized protein n=1 Tax=Pleurotus eryngii TaxID=5323 RepID=A0A9P5ZRJ5_PLEER|nr:hypothetical protein BDN71DRAFT_1224622 [Pleurotus eryngii]
MLKHCYIWKLYDVHSFSTLSTRRCLNILATLDLPPKSKATWRRWRRWRGVERRGRDVVSMSEAATIDRYSSEGELSNAKSNVAMLLPWVAPRSSFRDVSLVNKCAPESNDPLYSRLHTFVSQLASRGKGPYIERSVVEAPLHRGNLEEKSRARPVQQRGIQKMVLVGSTGQ